VGEFDVEPSRAISLDDAHRLISRSKAAAPVRAARKVRWRHLARLPARRPGYSAVFFFVASLAVPRESVWSLLFLVAAAVFGGLAFDRYKQKKKGGRRG
jgi:hypothetical protein